MLCLDIVTYVYDDVYDDVTYVYDDVTYWNMLRYNKVWVAMYIEPCNNQLWFSRKKKLNKV